MSDIGHPFQGLFALTSVSRAGQDFLMTLEHVSII